jgi:hypothetical protein
MAKSTAKTLARIHRVRTAQLGLARADELRATEALASETQLAARIDGLVAAVAPSHATTGGVMLAATAFYRDRLQQTALAVTTRVAMAEQRADRAAEATRSARRDESAVEKLIARARTAALAREARDLQNAPPQAKPKRHDPC